MTRHFVRRVARGLVGVLLLVQMSIAAYACPGSAAAPGLATQVPVCDDMVGSMDPAFANLCAEHCKYGQQSDQASTMKVPAAALVALYATAALPERVPPPRPAAASMSALVAASPPHAIAHCVYRI